MFYELVLYARQNHIVTPVKFDRTAVKFDLFLVMMSLIVILTLIFFLFLLEIEQFGVKFRDEGDGCDEEDCKCI